MFTRTVWLHCNTCQHLSGPKEVDVKMNLSTRSQRQSSSLEANPCPADRCFNGRQVAHRCGRNTRRPPEDEKAKRLVHLFCLLLLLLLLPFQPVGIWDEKGERERTGKLPEALYLPEKISNMASSTSYIYTWAGQGRWFSLQGRLQASCKKLLVCRCKKEERISSLSLFLFYVGLREKMPTS